MSVTDDILSPFDQLTDALRRLDRVVWVTGAGLSVASGIPTYRTHHDAIWSRFVTDWGTRARFRQQPLEWWKQFWLEAHGKITAAVRPNAGHLAMAQIMEHRPHDLIITQNIDGLHVGGGASSERVIEIHGRHDLFRCSNSSCKNHHRALSGIDLSIIEDDRLPHCARCGAPLRPLVLLFDEAYDSHPFYRSDEAFRAMWTADAMVFVGTSYAVGVTEMALQAAAQRGMPVFHLNLAPFSDCTDASGVAGSMPGAAARVSPIDVLGPSELTLPRLAAALGQQLVIS